MGRLGRIQHYSCLSIDFFFLPKALMSRTKAKNQLSTRYGAKHWFSPFCSYNFFMDCEHFLHKSFFMNIVVKYKEPKSRCMFRKKLAEEIILLALILRSPSSEKCFYVDQSSQGLNRGFKTKPQVETVLFLC